MSDDLRADPAAAIREQLTGIREKRSEKRKRFGKIDDRLPIVRIQRDYQTRKPNPGWALLPAGVRLTIKEVARLLGITKGTLYRNYVGINACRPLPPDIFVTRVEVNGNRADRVYIVRIVGKFACNIKRGVGV